MAIMRIASLHSAIAEKGGAEKSNLEDASTLTKRMMSPSLQPTQELVTVTQKS
jgi:hypothetical protein